jgi:hypothetical protein
MKQLEKVYTEPEILSRNDEEHGRWSVGEWSPGFGAPSTDIINKEMLVPLEDSEFARCVRAHEMMHAKISPGNSMEEWIKRKWATPKALIAVEEVRVNHLCIRAGISVDKHLKNGGFSAVGERIAQNEQWDEAVYTTIIVTETADLDPFIRGVKKVNPEWAKSLKSISVKIVKEFNKIDSKILASTEKSGSLPAPYGFSQTERIAAWVDNIANLKEEEEDDMDSSSFEKKKSPISSSQITESKVSHKTDEYGGEHDIPYESAWGQLNVKLGELSRSLPGSISRKRRASNVGNNPRRIHRLLTDPERRIFDARSRGKGGIVLLDASGSMSFSAEEIYNIVTQAPGAIVAMYSEDSDGLHGKENLVILAKNGKMVSEIPSRPCGNNVDLPALKWAVAQRTSSKTPVIWVTDGAVTAVDGEFYDVLAMQCVSFCKKERVVLAENAVEAYKVLSDLKSGRKPKWQWPQVLSESCKKMTGTSI